MLFRSRLAANHLSYYNTTAGFERVNGEVEIDGVPYQYVQRRIYNDSVEFLLIPNRATLNLRSGRDVYFGLINDLQQPQKGQKDSRPGVAPDFFGDPFTLTPSYRLADRLFSLVSREFYYHVRIPEGARFIGEHPPAFSS